MLRIDLLQKYRRRRPAFSWRPLGFGFLLGVLVSAAAGMFFFRPAWRLGGRGGLGGSGPDAPAVTVSPGGQAAASADAVIQGDSSGHLGGEAQLPPAGGQPPAPPTPPADHFAPGGRPGSGDYPSLVEIAPPEATSGADSGQLPCPGGLHPGDRADVPVQGNIHTVWVDSRTGAVVGQGDHPVEGITTVAVDEDLTLRVDTAFEDSVEIAIDIPAHPARWYVGGFAAAGFDGLEAGAFVEYRTALMEFPRLGAAMVAGGGVEVFRGGDGLGGRAVVRVGVVF